MRQAGRFDPRYHEIRRGADLPLEDLFRQPDAAAEISLLPKRLGVDAIIVFQDILTPLVPMGKRFLFRPGPILEEPVRCPGDVDALRPFDPSTELDFVAKTLHLIREALQGYLPLLGFAGAPLTLAFFLVAGRSPHLDSATARSMMLTEPALFHRFLDRLSDMTAEYLAVQIKAGVDAVQLFESAADLLSPDEYAEFAHPYHMKIFSKLDRRVPTILFAKDQPLVELMAASGADVLSVATSVDLADVKQRFGHKVAFQGNVDNRILLNGSAEEIDEAVHACVQAGRHEGHILNLGHGVLNGTPFENVCRFIDIAKTTRALAEH
jgi:uroporphyrinogen decarboxylase